MDDGNTRPRRKDRHRRPKNGENKKHQHPTKRKPKANNSNRKRRGRNKGTTQWIKKVEKNEDDVMVGIEEQLQKQRQEQRKRKESALGTGDEPAKKPPPPACLSNFEYDSQRDTYYPKGSMKKPPTPQLDQSPALTNGPKENHCNPAQPSKKTWMSTSLAAICHLQETCPSKNQRLRLRDTMAGRISFNSIQIVSAPHHWHNPNYQQDLFCKSLLHPARRTFDVATTGDYPLVATITDPHEIVFSNKLVFQHISERHTNIRHLPRLSEGRPGKSFTASLCDHEHGTTFGNPRTSFCLMEFNCDNDRDINVVFDKKVDRSPSDFCECSKDNTIVMAPTRANRNGPFKVAVIHTGQMGIVSVYRVPDLPRSDAFCIESSPVEALAYGSCAIGYRNGQIALWDASRSQRSCLATKERYRQSTNTDSFGAATSLSWLSNGHHVLARGSFGDLDMYDVRRMGNYCRSSGRSQRTEPSLVWRLSAPGSYDSARSKISLYCNGVATDPVDMVAIAPLLTETEDPCFGCWSLKTGEWIGSRLLQHPACPSTIEKPSPFLELCSVTTPSYKVTEEANIVCDPLNRNRFGLWFKCGRSVQPTDGSTKALKFCNIYHMSMIGQRCQ